MKHPCHNSIQTGPWEKPFYFLIKEVALIICFVWKYFSGRPSWLDYQISCQYHRVLHLGLLRLLEKGVLVTSNHSLAVRQLSSLWMLCQQGSVMFQQITIRFLRVGPISQKYNWWQRFGISCPCSLCIECCQSGRLSCQWAYWLLVWLFHLNLSQKILRMIPFLESPLLLGKRIWTLL